MKNKNQFSVITYLKKFEHVYKGILESLFVYVNFQTLKKYSSIDSLQDIKSHSIFVCFKFLHFIFVLCLFYNHFKNN